MIIRGTAPAAPTVRTDRAGRTDRTDRTEGTFGHQLVHTGNVQKVRTLPPSRLHLSKTLPHPLKIPNMFFLRSGVE